jgi:hypothetical protein
MSDRTHLGPALVACALLWGACQSDDAGGPIGKADVGPVIGAGFSAALRADLAKATGIPAPVALAASGTTAAGVTPAATGNNPAASGDKLAAAGDKPTVVAVAETSGDNPASSDKGAASTGGKPASGDKGAAPPTPTQGAVAVAVAVAVAPAPTGTTGVAAAGLSAELASVKLTLNEGWARDSVAPGTFSFFAPGEGGKNIRFVFRYAYEDATAPTQREPYKQWLASTKAMTVTVDRQRGAAWFLEGTDGAGVPAFRYVITYGGRLLTCGGSLYKQGPAAGLRDLRDEIIMQAKRICESMDL